MNKILLLLFPLLFVIFLFHYVLVGQAVYGDGIFYWSFARSIVVDHDINVGNEVLHHYDYASNNSPKETQYPRFIYQQHDKDYRLPIGASLSWIPMFYVAGAVGILIHIFGVPIVFNGYSNIYQITIGIGNVLFVLCGLYFVYRLVQTFYEKKVAVITTLFLFLASNLFYYGSIDVINSHPFTFLISSICVYFFFTKFIFKWYQWFILGVLIGMLALTRNQEIVFAILIPFGVITYWKEIKQTISQKIFQSIFFVLLSSIGIVIMLLPQLFLWNYGYGSFLHNPYLSRNAFNFLQPHILGVLINSNTGLLFTSPIVLLGFLGLLILSFQKKYLGLVGLCLFLAEYFVIASWSSWDQAASYGIRMLMSTYPVVALGLGFVLHKVFTKYSVRVILLTSCCFVLLNMIMIVHFHLSVKTTTIDNGQITRIAAQKKLNSMLHTDFQFFH